MEVEATTALAPGPIFLHRRNKFEGRAAPLKSASDAQPPCLAGGYAVR